MLKRTKRWRKGAILPITIVTFAVLMILGVSLLGSVTTQYRSAALTRDNSRGLAAADAGINYIYWRQRWARHDSTTVSPLPVTGLFVPAANQIRVINTVRTPNDTQTIGGESTDMWLLGTPPIGDASGLQVISRSTAGARHRAIRSVLYYGSGTLPTLLLDLPVFKNALFSEADLTLNPHSDITGSVWCNGTFRGHTHTSITGNLSYGPSTRDKFVRTTIGQSATKLTIDDFIEIPDLALDLANMPSGTGDPGSIVYQIGQSGKPTTFFANGSISLPKMQVKGPTTIIALGDIDLDDVIADNQNQSDLLLICTGNIHMHGGTFNGYIYCHNTDGTATFFGTNLDVNGAIIADDFKKLNGHCSVNYKPLNPGTFIPPEAGDPDLNDWHIATWELLY